MTDVKRVYTFGNKEAEGNGKMRELLGGKGANLAEMNLIGIPVPPGFTITTEVCAEYYRHGKQAIIELLRPEVEKAMKNIERLTGMKFGDREMPLLVSVRSGARASMPGMMDTILNLGMNDEAVEAVAKRTGNPRFAWDSYRRFVQMYGDVVLGMKPASKEDHDPFEVLIEEQKRRRGVKMDTDLTTDDLKELVAAFRKALEELRAEGGIAARHERYARTNAALREGMEALGFTAYIDKDVQGPIITTFLYPETMSFDFQDMYAFLKERGYVIYPGKLTAQDTFRLGNIGEIYDEDVQKILQIFTDYMKGLK